MRIGINGFGRIGRQVLKAILEKYKDKMDVVAINDLTDPATNAHLFKYDSNYGRYEGEVKAEGNSIIIDGKRIEVFAEREPSKIPWGERGVDIVIESTGVFTDAQKAKAHLSGGAKKVIITAPARNEDITIVLGVNEEKYDPEKHNVISNASCTTNCIAPIAKVLHKNFGIIRGLMSTIHAYTNDQRLLDMFHRDLRRARAAAMNIVPTTTGAARAVGLVLPELSGKLHGMAYRVPVSTVSVVDFVCDVEKDVDIDKVNSAFKEASEGELKGILEYTDEPLVSVDFKGNPASAIVDGLSTMVIDRMVKVVGWYDNEWAYSVRVADLAFYIMEKGIG